MARSQTALRKVASPPTSGSRPSVRPAAIDLDAAADPDVAVETFPTRISRGLVEIGVTP